jgi:hypothetical protein
MERKLTDYVTHTNPLSSCGCINIELVVTYATDAARVHKACVTSTQSRTDVDLMATERRMHFIIVVAIRHTVTGVGVLGVEFRGGGREDFHNDTVVCIVVNLTTRGRV